MIWYLISDRLKDQHNTDSISIQDRLKLRLEKGNILP